MKTFVELYRRDEFQLAEQLRRSLYILGYNTCKENYLPYYVVADKYDERQKSFTLTHNKNIQISMNVINLELDFAFQLWTVAQSVTKKKFPNYLNCKWQATDTPFKQFVCTDKNRKQAEAYFYSTLKELCNKNIITTQQRATFNIKNNNLLHLTVAVDEGIITYDICDELHVRFENGESLFQYSAEPTQYSFNEIKDLFVYCNENFLGLLNAEEGLQGATRQEKLLFAAAESSDLQGIEYALSQGANVNAMDIDGQTALTKIFQNFNTIVRKAEQNNQDEQLIAHTIEIAKYLLSRNADINLFGLDGLNALLYTAYSRNPILMKFLLDNGANPSINYFPDDDEWYIKSTALHTIKFSHGLYGDDKAVEACELLLRQAGAE